VSCSRRRAVFRLLRLISYPHLRASWGRTALVVGGIATGVSLIVAINVINASVLASVAQTFELIAGPADLEVTLGGGEIGFPESARSRSPRRAASASSPFAGFSSRRDWRPRSAGSSR